MNASTDLVGEYRFGFSPSAERGEQGALSEVMFV